MDIHFDCTQCGRCCHNLKLPLSVEEAMHWSGNGHQVQLLAEAAAAFEEPAIDAPERFRFDRSFPAASGTIPLRVNIVLVAAFAGPCPHLRPDMRCGNYDRRPRVCRIYPAEVSPTVDLVPEGKACPTEAWSIDRPLLMRNGAPADPELADLIGAYREATLADVGTKARLCLALGITTAAFSNEGYVVHSPFPATLFEALMVAEVERSNPHADTQWSVITNRRATLSMLEAVQARSATTRSGVGYIGFFDDDL